MIQRDIQSYVEKLATQFPIVGVMGPRQSGKTTLVKEIFAHYAYVTLEDLDKRAAAVEDPRGFFATYAGESGLIIDEVQEVPELLSYLQGIVDERPRPGFFILTGSQHFLLHEKITQSLAGRIALLTLLPLSIQELRRAQLLPGDLNALLIKGLYPRLYAQQIEVKTWIANYIGTYVEKDVRQVLRITDVIAFQRFLKLCAARVGNLLNYADLARDADISPNTAKAWISILEASFIIKLLYPYHKNFSKRVIKSPKLYFYDPALICFLLGIKTEQDIAVHPIRGALFESLVISECFKYNFNHNEQPQLYFWRDAQGHEIDCIVEKSFSEAIPIEIKARQTINESFFAELRDWTKITEQEKLKGYIIYSGDEQVIRTAGTIVTWRKITELLNEIYG